MAREKSFRVPDVKRFAASLTSVAEWVIIPGRTRPTLMVINATTTKMSSSAAIKDASALGTLPTARK